MTAEQLSKKVNKGIDAIVAGLLAHDKADHEGRPCITERIGVVAHLAHVLGVRGEWWIEAGFKLAVKDAECPCQKDHSCKAKT